MPNVLPIPMTRASRIEYSENGCIGDFRVKGGGIIIESRPKAGVTIKSEYKSESVFVGINQSYLVSVQYRHRTFPIWLALSVIFGVFGLLFVAIGELLFVGLFCLFVGLLFLALFFETKRAKLSFFLADEQDYHILLASKAIKDPKAMSEFVHCILLNSLVD
jgi:hypothetical protein